MLHNGDTPKSTKQNTSLDCESAGGLWGWHAARPRRQECNRASATAAEARHSYSHSLPSSFLYPYLTLFN